MIVIPEYFKPGLTFNSKYINDGFNICKIISFDKDINLCEVQITTTKSKWIENDWNLEHTIFGFENMDYIIEY